MGAATADEHGDRGPVAVAPVRWRDREPVQLPAPLTPLLGRETEVAGVVALLRAEHPRLVTLTGPGGVGKTRLALQVAYELVDDYPDGVVFVPLAPLRDGAAVVAAIAAQLGVREAGDRPLIERVRSFLRHQDVLLVLDNFEQVLSATPDVVDLLTGCPGIKVLVTSRTRLHVTGEHVFPVPPLPVPATDVILSTDRLGEMPAVRLFVERARAVRPQFALTERNAEAVAAICRRVDGLPLAIELAAARIAVLPPGEVLARLEPRLAVLTGGAADLPARLRTMREAIGWSYDLLTPEDKALFRRLAGVGGGFTLAAAEAVADGETERGGDGSTDDSVSLSASVLAGIERLLNASLVHRDEVADAPRFAMLETIREFGLEQLETSGEASATRRRHAAWCVALADDVNRHMERPDLEDWWPRLAADHDNLRTALDWLEATGDAATALRLAASLWRFWYHDSHVEEGERRLTRTLAASGDAPVRLRRDALIGAAMLAHFRDADAAGVAYCEEALALSQEDDDPGDLARVRYVRGLIDEDAGRYEAAETAFGEALSLFSAAGDDFWVGMTLTHLGIAAYGLRDLARARTLLTDALNWQRARGFRWEIARTLLFLAQVDLVSDNVAGAGTMLAEALALSVGPGAPRSVVPDIVATTSVYAAAMGRPKDAARLLGWAAIGWESAGRSSHLPERTLYERAERAVRTALGPEGFAVGWEDGRAFSTTQVLAQARMLVAGEGADNPDESGQIPIADLMAETKLTPRETEVLRLLARHLTDKEIAAELALSPRTVMHHVSSLLGKLGVATRREAAAWAVRHGLG